MFCSFYSLQLSMGVKMKSFSHWKNMEESATANHQGTFTSLHSVFLVHRWPVLASEAFPVRMEDRV